MEPKTELQRNAQSEARRKELETYQRALDIQWMNNRMEDGRMGQCLALIKREADMEKDFQERTDHAAIVDSKAESEIALGLELAKIKEKEECELMRSHQLRENDPELRELIKKMKAGYVCRDLKQQILQNEHKRQQDKIEEDRSYKTLQDSIHNEREFMDKEDEAKIAKTTKYRLELQQQLVNNQKQKQCEYEDTLIEKKMLDEVTRVIFDEDKRELQQKREQTEKLRKEMVTSQQARASWKEKQRALITKEETALEEQLNAVQDRTSSILEERQRKMQVKEELNDKVIAKIRAAEVDRLEREDLVQNLQEQEHEELCIQDERNQKLKLETVRSEMKRDLMQQMDTKKRLREEERNVDNMYRKMMEENMLKEDQIELEKQKALREKAQQYQRDLKLQIEDNARRRNEDKIKEDNRAKDVWDFNEAWSKEVADERSKIIKEHIPSVLGHIQQGVLDDTDIPSIKTGIDESENPGSLLANIDRLAEARKSEGHPKCNAQCRVLREY